MNTNFWHKLFSENKVVLGLSPMDGVTDAAMRYMVAKYGKPDVMFTEFVNVDALHYADGERRKRLLKTLLRASTLCDSGYFAQKNGLSASADAATSCSDYPSCAEFFDCKKPLHRSQFPCEVAQVFGKTPELFAEAAILIEKLGFDGIDINMGCPAHKVEENGCGAGLIRTPELAQEIVRTVRGATKLPVSVKTRIGVMDKSEMGEWIEALMEVKPAIVSLHGRTLKQMYTGSADWEVIGQAAEIVHKWGGKILGNGDVKSRDEAEEKVRQYGVDGVLIGRAAEGNPMVFKGGEISTKQRLSWALEHTKVYEKVFGDNFLPMRKHLAWYCAGFSGAVEMRMKLVQVNSAKEVEDIIEKFSSDRG